MGKYRGCYNCGHWIPNHVPGQGDCMHPAPKGCIEETGFHKWTGEQVPAFALNYVRQLQAWCADLEAQLDAKAGSGKEGG